MKLRTVILLASLTTTVAASSYYKLEMVKRLEKDLYSARSGPAKVLIETKYCYEYAFNDDAVLKYDAYSYDNKIIFDDNASCDVARVVVR